MTKAYVKAESVGVSIGKILRNARIDKGYHSRSSLVETKGLKGRLTHEGLRKIEAGERVPRLENLRAIAEALGLKEVAIRRLERMALQSKVSTVARKAGNASISFAIDGKPFRVESLPPRRKTEHFVRGAVTELLDVVRKYGILEADEEHFRRHARAILLKRLSL